MKTFFCYEIATDNSNHSGAYENLYDFIEAFVKMKEFLGEQVDTFATGTCLAGDAEAALVFVYNGRWSYSQKV